MTEVKGKSIARQRGIDERVTHLFISPGYRQPERSLHGPMCSDRLGREMSTPGRVEHG